MKFGDSHLISGLSWTKIEALRAEIR
jgi:hypothetical protein